MASLDSQITVTLDPRAVEAIRDLARLVENFGLTAIRILHPEPHDTLVLETPNKLSPRIHEMLSKWIKDKWPTLECIILEDGTTLSAVIKPPIAGSAAIHQAESN